VYSLLFNPLTTPAMNAAINANWKNEVRAFFASPDEVAYRNHVGAARPTLTQVKLEIANRRKAKPANAGVAALVSKLYRD
jgi:hypothetical protein